MKKIQLSQNKTAIVDDADYQILSAYQWSAKRYEGKDGKKTFYAVRRMGKKIIPMHREIMKVRNVDRIVDHINGNGLDNRRANLRVGTKQDNRNNARATGGKTSKHKGVHYWAERKKWVAQITRGEKRKTLGLYDTEQDAAKAYDKAAKKIHGSAARLNRPA